RRRNAEMVSLAPAPEAHAQERTFSVATMNPEEWKSIREKLHVVRRWIAARPRRASILLVALAIVVFLLPLAIDVMTVFWYWLPSNLRRTLGEAVFLGLVAVGLWRLAQVRSGESWPPLQRTEGRESIAVANRWIPWLLRAAVASLAA